MVHDGNKDESEKCLKLAQKYFNDGSRDKAIKFAMKAQKLCPTEKCNDFIELLIRLNATESQYPQSNGSTTGGSSNTSSHQRKNSNENIRNRKPESSTTDASTPKNDEYTSEQLEAVKKVKKCKDYYEILGVTKEAGDSDLKKAYRKLALQFHPDKNKAPGADEAFKAVGNAFSVLSDAEKRKQYNLYGPDETSQGQRSYNQQDYTRGYEGDVTADELFNMFFGGGYPGGSVYMRRNGRWERPRPSSSGGGGGGSAAGRTTTGHNHSHESTADQSGLSVFLQLMPLLLILFLSFASSFLSPDPVYSFSPTSKYPVQRTTHNLGVTFYVKSDFATEFQGSVRRLEQQVEEDYVTTLRSGCYKERNYKDNMIWRARSFGDANLYRKAQDLRTPSCDTLQDLYS